jgi:hypothetical protein
MDVYTDRIHGAGDETATAGATPTASWRVGIVQPYKSPDPVTMRLFMSRRLADITVPECQIFRFAAVRRTVGAPIESVDNILVQFPPPGPPTGDGSETLVIDLPINSAEGLNVFVTTPLAVGQLLTFGIEFYDPGCPDFGAYKLFGVEFFETAPDAEVLSGATILPDVPEGCIGACGG